MYQLFLYNNILGEQWTINRWETQVSRLSSEVVNQWSGEKKGNMGIKSFQKENQEK